MRKEGRKETSEKNVKTEKKIKELVHVLSLVSFFFSFLLFFSKERLMSGGSMNEDSNKEPQK